MLDGRDDKAFTKLLKDIFERRVLLDHFSLATYCTKIAGFLCKVQHYYNLELHEESICMLKEVSDLLQYAAFHNFKDKPILDYLKETQEDLALKVAGNEEIEKGDCARWSDEIISEGSLDIPGMLYPDTMKYYQWLGANMVTNGKLVELGCWLGQSTYCLAEGLSKAGLVTGNFHVFDSFVWEDWMGDYMDPDKKPDLGYGESFLPLFKKNCEHFQDLISTNTVDIFNSEKKIWEKGPISVFIYDISHEESLIEETWSRFEPSFIPGQTIVVFNQYGNFRAETVRRFCRQKGDRLKPVHKINGAAKAFLFK